jgi:hypothetical protein
LAAAACLSAGSHVDGDSGVYAVTVDDDDGGSGSDTLTVPVHLVIASISNAQITVANADGTTADGRPYLDLSSQLGDGVLDPGDTVTKRVYFSNPNRVRSSFQPSLYGAILP